MPVVLWAILVFGCAVFYTYGAGQDFNFDLRNYHYYAGYSLLHGTYSTDLAAADLQSFLHPAANVISYLAFSSLAFPFGAWLILLLQLLLLPVLIKIAAEIGKGVRQPDTTDSLFIRIAALSLCILAPLWWSELGTSFSSSTTAVLLLAGVLYLLRGINDVSIRSNFLLSGVLIGLAAGLKLTNAPFALSAIAAYALVNLRLNRSSVTNGVMLGLGLFVGFSSTAWWYLYLYHDWQSPLYPLYNGIFRSPYFDFFNYRDPRWYFPTLGEFLQFLVEAFNGTTKTSEVAFADSRLISVMALAGIAVPFINRDKLGKTCAFFLLFCTFSVWFWATTFAYQRYLIPIELLLGFNAWILLGML